ncbi:MAG TPA: hypothetical protein VEI97_06965, partial [bacterium]|nr:hypothetical protein [bacterium]
MRTIYGWLLATLAAAALSCGGGDDSPATPGDPTPGELGATALPGGDALPAPTGFAGLGGYTLEVDLNSLSATATMWRKGAATDDLYFLAVDNFLRPNSLAVESIQVTPTTVNLNYRFTHPFPAPTNLAGPATAGNRADLGIAARLLVLADVPGATGNTYF